MNLWKRKVKSKWKKAGQCLPGAGSRTTDEKALHVGCNGNALYLDYG